MISASATQCATETWITGTSTDLRMSRDEAEARSRVMQRIRKTNTSPELALRKALWSAGVRGYRLYVNLPGRPDIVFRAARIAIFVDGCFWHRCSICKIPLPRSNRSYWLPKMKRNTARDRRANKELTASGWLVLRFWEHSVHAEADLIARQIKSTVTRRRHRTPATAASASALRS
jgi:DNA mismatch endonuclease (patch repair protein)